MKDIAAEAGVALGLAHYYFETKEDLLVAAIERGCAPLLDELSRQGIPLDAGMSVGLDAFEAARRGFELTTEELRRYRELHILVNDMFGSGLLLAGSIFAFGQAGSFSNFQPASTQASQALKLIQDELPQPGGSSFDIVFSSQAFAVSDPAFKQAMMTALQPLAADSHIKQVLTPYDTSSD